MRGFSCVAVLALLLAVAVNAAEVKNWKDCRGQPHEEATCAPPGTCKHGVTVSGLCDPLTTDECCFEDAHDTFCQVLNGTCVEDSDCADGKIRIARHCPGSSTVVCCAPVTPASLALSQISPVDKTPREEKFVRVIRNKIKDIKQLLVVNMTLPDVVADRKMCWPLKRLSSKKLTVTDVSWGASRQNGRSCHAGVDLFTASPGEVIAITHGQVVAVNHGFTACTRGWGIDRKGIPMSTVSVMVFHPDLERTVNYAELDPDKLRVSVGDTVERGQDLGIASYCGMLHFELYRGLQTKYHSWKLPKDAPRLSPVGNRCAMEYLASKARTLTDPRPLLHALEGRFCA